MGERVSVRVGLFVLAALLLALAVACGGSTPDESPLASPSPSSSLTTPPVATAEATHRVYIPSIQAEDRGAEATSVVPSPTPDPTPSGPTPLPPPVPKPGYGLQFNLMAGDLGQTLRRAQGLGVGWVKQQVAWHTIEHGPGDMDWAALDQAVDGAHQAGFKLLLSVTHAPDWTRAAERDSGPPVDYAQFRRFMEQLAARYRAKVAAYELWNEPNLAREWSGDALDPARFVALVAEGAQGVRAGDPNALVISGAPAVTGINDGQVAIDDRVFLQGMYEAGVDQWIDGIGAHPYGFANPPHESWRDESHRAPSHNEHPSFFFRDTLEDYHAIAAQHGDAERPIWATEFGWPSFDGLGDDLPNHMPYAAHVSEQEQAAYILAAFRYGEEREWVGPMFLWNLNMSTTWGSDHPHAPYSLFRPNGAYRPAYIELRLAEPLSP